MEYLVILFSYLIGSIPFGLVIGKCVGVDVRAAGSGNIGATNVNRLLGKKLGVLTLLADSLKAVVPMIVTALLLKEDPDRDWITVLSGGAAFVGHIYPIYLRFNGGKGVATALGVFCYLNPVAVFIAALFFVGIVFVTGYVSLGSLCAAAVMPIALKLMSAPNEIFALSVFIAALIWIKHRENIYRLLRHEENSLKKKG